MSITSSQHLTQPQLPLEAGDHLDQATFHVRYESMPPGVRAELVAGVVYMPSPLRAEHGDLHAQLITWLTLYAAATPATRALDNATIILGQESEPQPDGCLLLRAEHGGRTRLVDGYVTGAPELVAEVALSSASYDLHSKYDDYESAGIDEYIVLNLHDREVHWFVLERGSFVRQTPDDDGIFRSQRFPGLWLDGAAMLDRNTRQLSTVLDRGIASTEHAQFISRPSP